MKKKIFILLSIFVLGLTITLCIINIKDNKTNISYKEENIDWSKYETKEIELTESLTITNPGIYILSGKITGSVTINTSDYVKLILNGVEITNNDGPAIMIENSKKTYIELNENTTNILTDNGNSENDGVIYSKDDLVITGTGTLEITANNQDGIVSKDSLVIENGNINITSIDDGIRGKDFVTILNGNINISSTGDGIKATNEKDTSLGYILIENGNITINSKQDGIQAATNIKILDGTFKITTGNGSTTTSKNSSAWGKINNSTDTVSKKAIKAGNDIIINGCTFEIDSEDDSIHSNNNIEINAGTYTLSTGDDGIHADTNLTIKDGKIDITKSYEGLEASVITIDNGQISIIASDDGINVAGGSDSSSLNRPGENNFDTNTSYILTINDGYIYVNADGDGLDSNGKIIMNGGTVLVDGPTNDGNGALDYETEFIINGGTLVAVGSSGMAEGISSNSTQNGVLINFENSYEENTIINIDGIITYSPSKKFSSIVVSTKDIKLNESYNITIGGEATGTVKNGLYVDGTYSGGNLYQTYTQSSVATTIGNKMNGNPGMGPDNNQRPGEPPERR